MSDLLFQMIKRRRSTAHQYLLFLGAGASLSSGLPTFQALFQAAGTNDYEQFSELVDGLSETERYTLVSDALTFDGPSRSAHMLASLIRDGYFSIILTTNFDTVMEEAFQKVGLRPSDYKVFVNDCLHPLEDLDLDLTKTNHRIKLVKLHGDISRGRFALSQRDTNQFCSKLEAPLRRLLASRDTILIGSEIADLDILRCFEGKGGSLWYVNPQRPTSHIAGLMRSRNCHQNIIHDDLGKAEVFIDLLVNFLADENDLTLRCVILAPMEYSCETRPMVGREITGGEHCSIWEFDALPYVRLYIFKHGIAVWRLDRTIAFQSITQFAEWRRREYQCILNGTHDVCQFIHKHFNCGDLQDQEYKPLYAFTICSVEGQPPWPTFQRENALKLLSFPSILNPRFDNIHTSFPENEYSDIESEYLISGLEHSDVVDFSLKGIQMGFASWSGFSYFASDPSRAADFDEIVEYEVHLQSLWAYYDSVRKGSHLLKMSAIDSLNQIRNKLHIPATEPSVLRLCKEAIVRTSRIMEKEQEARGTL